MAARPLGNDLPSVYPNINQEANNHPMFTTCDRVVFTTMIGLMFTT